MRSNNNIAHKKVHTHSGQKTDDSVVNVKK